MQYIQGLPPFRLIGGLLVPAVVAACGLKAKDGTIEGDPNYAL